MGVSHPRESLVDVTPFDENPLRRPICTAEGSVAFLFDENAYLLKTEHGIASRPLQFFAIGNDPTLKKYVNAQRDKEREAYSRDHGVF
jgi:hypothetical protein